MRVKAFQNARDFYQSIELKHKVKECDSYIRQVGMIAVAIPMKAPEITVTHFPRKYSPFILRGNRLRTVLARFVQNLVCWVKCLSRRLRQLVRVK
jgi:hypothetical protein